jgi:hypothetical protein
MMAKAWRACHGIVCELYLIELLKHLQHAWSLLQTVCMHVVLSANRHA